MHAGDRGALANKLHALLRPYGVASVAALASQNALLTGLCAAALAETSIPTTLVVIDPCAWVMVVAPPQGPTIRRDLTFPIPPTLDDLVRVTGHQMRGLMRAPQHPRLADAIVQVHLHDDGFRQWRAWLHRWAQSALPDAAPAPEGDALAPFRDAVQELAPGYRWTGAALRILRHSHPRWTTSYLGRDWMKDVALSALSAIPGATDAAIIENLVVRGSGDVDLGCAAIIDGRLHVVLCVPSDRATDALARWSEVAPVARRFGGPSAHLALMTLADNETLVDLDVTLRHEPPDLPPGVVFGRTHLERIAQHIRVWAKPPVHRSSRDRS